MKKIAIIGCGATGKSTLAKELGNLLRLPVYHLDEIYWKENWRSIPREEFIEKQRELVEKDRWIIDGNYTSTMDLRLEAADTVIFLDYKTATPLGRALKRTFTYYGKPKPDIAPQCKEHLDPKFLKIIWDYNRNERPIILKKLNALKLLKRIIILKNQRQRDLFLETVA